MENQKKQIRQVEKKKLEEAKVGNWQGEIGSDTETRQTKQTVK